MALLAKLRSIEPRLSRLIAAIANSRGSNDQVKRSIDARVLDRWISDAAATRFHLQRAIRSSPQMIAIIGGTGTGKSTLLNRLLETEHQPVSAASFRRTFTAGPVAVAGDSRGIPDRWLNVPHVEIDPASYPARGEADRLTIARSTHPLAQKITLIDTPDLDGDQPLHHAQADRVFRWADVVVFLVTPEKYQMTELQPYYRLANRYALQAIFVMNKVESQAVADDYARLLPSDASLFSIARDDSGFVAPPELDLPAFRARLGAIETLPDEIRSAGLRNRVTDLLSRATDQIVEPLRANRVAIAQTIANLRAFETPALGVDVSPLMSQLRRRMQQRSVLYLMGPGRVLDRVRQVPNLIARLPRHTWDLFRRGKIESNPDESTQLNADAALDFETLLVDQMRLVQARLSDIVSTHFPTAPNDFPQIDPTTAGAIATEELDKLRDWLGNKWNATPRDTAVLTRLIRYLPGGEKLARWSEAAPYLLAAIVAAHHAFFGPVDLMVIGGFSVATWITERLSNEVAWHTRETNRAIDRRFAELAHQQILNVCAWLNAQAPDDKSLDQMQTLIDEIAAGIGSAT